MSESFKAPHNLAEIIDPLKETFTWKWVAAVCLTVILAFMQFVIFLGMILLNQLILAGILILSCFATLVLFFIYALTPQKLEENYRRVLFEGRIKKGIDTFSKHSPFVKKWVIQNFTGLVEVDEETGLCREKPNKELY